MATTIPSVGPFGPGMRRVATEESRRRYFRSTSALWNRNSVAGLRIAASFATRRGRTNSVINSSTNRSIVVRGWGASTGAAADNQLVLEQQRLGDDGADPTGSTRLPVSGVPRYARRIRTPQAAVDAAIPSSSNGRER